MKTFIKTFPTLILICICMLVQSCKQQNESSKEDWQALFNGKDLAGWDIKVAGEPLNVNYKNTFQAEDSMLRIKYDQYEKFNGKFAHLYTQLPYSYYKLRFQYRIVGTHLQDAPSWGDRNSGIMIHSQSAKSMDLNQDFPVSLEMQLLADTGKNDRRTGNICTPGTQVHMQGILREDHCLNSTSDFYKVDQWVNGIVEVYGDSLVRHIIEDETVLTYTKPIIGGGFVSDVHSWTKAGITDSLVWINKANTPLGEGHIALQAESQPIDFRKIEILNLVGCMDKKAKNYRSYYVKAEKSACRY